MKKLVLILIYIVHTAACLGQDIQFPGNQVQQMQGNEPEYRGGDEEFNLRINEFSAAGTEFVDQEGENEDWIEIYNLGDEAVDLSELFMTDNPLNPFKWSLSALTSPLEAGQYLILFADDEPEVAENHLGFSLNEEGEFIGLYDENGLEIDAIDFGQQSFGLSFGREGDGEIWNYLLETTPGSSNSSNGLLGILEPVEFNLSSGFYTGTQTIVLQHPDDFSEIRYTFGGLEPNALSTLYEGAFEVEPGEVIRAKAFRIGYHEGQSSSCTLLQQDNYALNAMLITGDYDELFGENGIYSNPYSGIERQVQLSYLEDGNLLLNQLAGIQLHAPDNRDQKALRLYARNEYGQSRFEHAFFEDKGIQSFKRLILRNAGNDGLEIGHSGLRDPLISNLYASMEEGYGYSATAPMNVFINGDYWGIYNLRERQDEYFIQDNYGYEPEEVNYLERAASVPGTFNAILGNWDDFNNLEETAVLLDLSEDENYALIEDWMNIENFVDYQSLEIFICNQDWLSNNMKFWRTYNSDRKWEWLIWDSDWGFGTFYPSYIHGSPDWNSLNFALSNWGGWTQEVETELLQNLVLNTEFRNYFSSRSADLTNSVLRPDRILEKLDGMKSEIENDMPFQVARWGSTVGAWNYDLGVISNFVSERKGYFLQHFSERFELGEILTIQLECIPAEAGYIEVNTIFADESPWEGQYFENIPVRIKAIANPGYVFEEWEDIGTASELLVSLLGDSTINALFGQSNELLSPIINEIYYNPGDELQSGEWIELYNPNLTELNLNGWVLGNELEVLFEFDGEFILQAEEYAILCQDTLAFQAMFPGVEHLHLQLSHALSDESGTIYLLDGNQSVQDYVNYSNSGDWPLEGNGDNFSLELISPELNNNSGQNWFVRDVIGGSPGAENEIVVGQLEKDECSIIAYPNPFNSQFKLASGCGFIRGDVLEIYDSFGRSVFQKIISGSGPSLTISFPADAKAGIYSYSLRSESTCFKGSVIKVD